MRDAFIATLTELTETNPQIMLITGDLGFGVLTDFAIRYPTNYLNAGVAEQNMTMLAAGLAQEGRTVFTYSIANFPTLRCLEMLRNDVLYHDLPVTAVAVGGGFSYGALGMSHHATEDIAIMRALPGMTVLAPSTTGEVCALTADLVANPRPSYLRLDKAVAADTGTGTDGARIGQARTLRTGSDVAIISCGGITQIALDAAARLENQGRSTRVVSLHTVCPIDVVALLDIVENCGVVITLEEHVLAGGLGSAVLEALVDHGASTASVRRLGLPSDSWAGVGDQDYLRTAAGLTVDAIVAAATRIDE